MICDVSCNCIISHLRCQSQCNSGLFCVRLQAGECMVILATGAFDDEAIIDTHDPHSPHISSHISRSTGLASKHAYACLDMRCVQGHLLMQLKNPWSRGRWKGTLAHARICF